MKNKRNQEMYEIYMANPSFGYKDIAEKFNLSEKTVSIIICDKMRKINVKRDPKPIGNKAAVHDKVILDTFLECLSANSVSRKLKVSHGYILKLVRNNGYGHLIKPRPVRKSELDIEKRNQEIWEYFLEYQPKNFRVIAEKFNLNITNVKHIMRALKKEHNYPIRGNERITTRIKNEYERVAEYLGIDSRNLFAY